MEKNITPQQIEVLRNEHTVKIVWKQNDTSFLPYPWIEFQEKRTGQYMPPPIPYNFRNYRISLDQINFVEE